MSRLKLVIIAPSRKVEGGIGFLEGQSSWYADPRDSVA